MVPQTRMTALRTVNVSHKDEAGNARTCGCIDSDFQLSADHNLSMPIMQSMEIPWQCSLSACTVQLATLINYFSCQLTVHPLQIWLQNIHGFMHALCHAVTAAFLLC